MRQRNGFTLIELAMVALILGILAFFALPRFANLGNDPQVTIIKGAAGSVKSAIAIAHSMFLAHGLTNGTVTLDGGATVAMTSRGYPSADAAGIGVAAQLGAADFDIKSSGPTATISIKRNGKAVGNCNFTYDASTGTINPPVTGGC